MALRHPKVRERFLAALMESGCVTYAAHWAGVARKTAYRHRERFRLFAAEWDAALDEHEKRELTSVW